MVSTDDDDDDSNSAIGIPILETSSTRLNTSRGSVVEEEENFKLDETTQEIGKADVGLTNQMEQDKVKRQEQTAKEELEKRHNEPQPQRTRDDDKTIPTASISASASSWESINALEKGSQKQSKSQSDGAADADFGNDDASLLEDILNSQDTGTIALKTSTTTTTSSRGLPVANMLASGLSTPATTTTTSAQSTSVLTATTTPDNSNLSSPGAFSMFPSPNQPGQRADDESTTNLDVEGASQEMAAEQQPGDVVVARLVVQTDEQSQMQNDTNNEVSEQLTVQAFRHTSHTQKNRLLVLLIGVLFIAIIITIAVTLGGGDKPQSAPNTNPVNDSIQIDQGPTTTAPAETPTTLPPILLPPASRAPVVDSGADLLPKGKLYCGTKSLGQIDYRGTTSMTKSGRQCQPWADKFPHNHNENDILRPNHGLQSNYCRNPDGTQPNVWCYTMDPNVRNEGCEVPDCNYCGVDFEDAQTNCKSTCLLDEECPDGESCFEDTTCEVASPLVGSDQFYCGETFLDAHTWCRKPCPSGYSNFCSARELCFAATSCVGAGDASYCGTDFEHANEACEIPCNRGSAAQCPPGQLCFADTSCGGGA